MHKVLRHIRDNVLTPVNPVVGNGIAYSQMQEVENVIDNIMSCAFSHDVDNGSIDHLPMGFEYIGYELVSPEEAFAVKAKQKAIQRPRSTKMSARYGLDISKTDTYLVKFNFRNNGEKLAPRYIAIPFVRRGGIMHIKGTRFAIMPVLRTRGLTRLPNEYFIKLPSILLSFNWTNLNYIIDGKSEHVYLPYSKKLHVDCAKPSARFLPPVALWLFAKHGVFKTFKIYHDVDISVYDREDPKLRDIDKDIYSICKTKVHLRRMNPPRFVVVVKRADLTPVIKVLIGTMFYVARCYPEEVTAENINIDLEIGLSDEVQFPRLWQIMVGRAIWKESESDDGRLINRVQGHLISLERRMDKDARMELLSTGITCDNIYQFLNYTIERMVTRDGNEYSNSANLWGRYYTTTEHVIKDIKAMIYNTHHKLVRMSGESKLTSVISQIINLNIHRDTIMRINNEGHGEVTSFMTASDNMLAALTCHCIDQADTSASKGKSDKVFDLFDSSKHAHASLAEVGCVANLPKSCPIGYTRINSKVMLAPDYQILRNPHKLKLSRLIEADIKSKGVI